MKITFLGTCHGFPEKNRGRSAVSVEVGGSIYLIDAGGPVACDMINRDMDIKKLKAVFITHTHADHIDGLFDLIRITNNTIRYSPTDIDYYFPENNAIDAINYYMKEMGEKSASEDKFHVYSEGVVYTDDNIRLSVTPTGHLRDSDRPAFRFVLEAEGKRILFSGDMSQNLKYDDFPHAVKHEVFDLFVCEMAHFDFEVLRPHFEECIAKQVYVTHIKFPDERIPLLEEENKSGKFKFPILAAYDGDVVEL
jgi:ribonuclease BN (tRNA processing enzyme)